ncbi:MAG: formate dehydrogenase accessory sulfurtransferase FdhD [Mucilaginibacter polytrichastri]|nr:formate dehydrogenase accessory sulfurtransferase FdhD [Mucilaginibacter polytrichastri]
MPLSSVVQAPVVKVQTGQTDREDDHLVVEEPLEIRLEYGPADHRRIQNVSVIMRTPGNDTALATGFLFTEGIIADMSEIASVQDDYVNSDGFRDNIMLVKLQEEAVPNLQKADRNFYATSTCGVCGKASIGAVRTVAAPRPAFESPVRIDPGVLHALPGRLAEKQQLLSGMGELHASAFFTAEGDLLMMAEDVGRHNALDKLIGEALEKKLLPLEDHILLLSGRASFELMQKAAISGVKLVAAMGAPSSLAVQLAEEFGMALIGFLREGRFNIYTGENRLRAVESSS